MKLLLGFLAVVLVSCGSDEAMRVTQFHLQDTEVDRDYDRLGRENQFVRGEINRRVYGAVTAKERELRKGNYYTVLWKDLSGTQPIRVVFEYRQQRTGAKILKMEQRAAASESGKVEFQVIGDSYQKSGRVLSWRATLYEGGNQVGVKKSYLWD